MGKLGEILPLRGHGTLRVHLENAAIRAGEELIGSVQLNVSQPIEVQSLGVAIDGKERIQWEEANQADGTKNRNEQILLTDETTLLVPPGNSPAMTLPQGNYNYPFKFLLPENLAASFEYRSREVKGLDIVYVDVEYNLTVKLSLQGELKTDIKWSVPFVIEHPFDTASRGRSVSLSTSEVVRSMGIFKKGTCSVRMDMENDVLDAETPIQVRAGIDNAFRESARGIHLTLYEDVWIDRKTRGGAKVRQSSRVICTRSFDPIELRREATPKLVLPVLPNNIYHAEPMLPSLKSHFIHALSYRVVLEIPLSSTSKATVAAPVTVVRKPRVAAFF
ncbi:hypothetical protein Poli38472_010157 [Pythium oligandrum]|uniref:Arrestin-like N-terminal domain-containing protein n=1 Tax=Pythium oligandrum TaxID=41045 RepID=A0A8K1C9E6_PYTOL|nr:hypothetical protein Poli38472_010157 [Pythium oligandrum]|eukprot:TMW58598.1 hypothetical protein Poli38472_010157 [Pythium oligandrum]